MWTRTDATRRRRRSRIELNLASMIDVTFLLLLYFLVTTVLALPEDRLSAALQTESARAGAAADFQPQVVEVLSADGAPAYRLGSAQFRDKASLTRALEKLHRPSGLFIKVFDGVPVGVVAAAMQAGRDAGFEQVTYVAAK